MASCCVFTVTVYFVTTSVSCCRAGYLIRGRTWNSHPYECRGLAVSLVDWNTPKMSHIFPHKDLHITRDYIAVMGASDMLIRVKDPIASARRGDHSL